MKISLGKALTANQIQFVKLVIDYVTQSGWMSAAQLYESPFTDFTLTALAFVLIIGKADRFQCGKQIASYLGLVPLEKSSGNQRRLGHIRKPGNSLLRFLLVEAAQVTARSIPEWRSTYVHLTLRRGRKIAKVARARKLAVGLYWMMRKEWDYEQLRKFGSHAGEPGSGDGGKKNIAKLSGYPAPLHGEFEIAIMIERGTEEMHGSN